MRPCVTAGWSPPSSPSWPSPSPLRAARAPVCRWTRRGGSGRRGGTPVDAAPDRDAAVDAPPDRVEDVPDVFQEGLPECDPEALYIYLITSQTILYRFDPATNTLTSKGAISCPAGDNATPFSMGVDRTGRAFVVYNNGQLFAVDVETAACTDIGYEVNQELRRLRLGFAIDDARWARRATRRTHFGEASMAWAPSLTQTLDLDFVRPSGTSSRHRADQLRRGCSSVQPRRVRRRLVFIQIDKEDGPDLDATFRPSELGRLALPWGGDFTSSPRPRRRDPVPVRSRHARGRGDHAQRDRCLRLVSTCKPAGPEARLARYIAAGVVIVGGQHSPSTQSRCRVPSGQTTIAALGVLRALAGFVAPG